MLKVEPLKGLGGNDIWPPL